MNSAFHGTYRGRRVMVTGHSGFKGSWLALWLKRLGAEVVGLSLPSDAATRSLFDHADAQRGTISVWGDIRNLETVEEAIRTHAPEVIFHCAAQAIVLHSYLDPLFTYGTNVLGTANVLDVARRTQSVRAVVVVTSDKCYENTESATAFREGDPLGGRDPYSSSKACAELVTSAYRHSFFSSNDSGAIASVRAGNVIGGGDWAPDRIVPDFVRSIERGSPLTLRNPDAIRPWQHVLDPVCGYLRLGDVLFRDGQRFAEAWNFGPDEASAVTVRELTRRFLFAWGDGEALERSMPGARHEARYLKLDSAKSRSRLGWSPLLDLDLAVEMTVRWYRAVLASPGTEVAMAERQIAEYETRLLGGAGALPDSSYDNAASTDSAIS